VSVTEAIFGLVGVIVGALITGLVEWLGHRRGEKRAARAAMRVLASDIAVGIAMLNASKAGSAWWVRPAFSLPTGAWAEYRDLLASHLDRDSDWLDVAAAFQEFADLNSYVAAHDASAGGVGAAIFNPATDSAFLEDAIAKARRGGGTLIRLLG
jgi:hypothetical protein